MICLITIHKFIQSSFFIIFLALLFNTASAETGTMSVSTNQIYNYPLIDIGGGGGASTLGNFSIFKFDVADYNKIVNMSLDYGVGALNYPAQSNVTEFHCVTPNTCNGIFSYSAALHKMSWVFSSTNIDLISSPIIFTYDDAILTGLTAAAAVNTRAGSPDVDSPFCPLAASGNCATDISTYPAGLAGIDVSTSATIDYNITYPIPGWYNFFVDKTGNTIQSRVFFHSQSNNTLTRAWETSFTTTNFSGSSQYTDGLYLNLSLAGGEYNDVLINTTNATGIATATPTPVVNPVTGKGIIFDRSEYQIGDTATISWAIGDSIWNIFSTQTIVLKKADSGSVFTSISSIAPQTGSYQYLFSECVANQIVCGYGTYEAIMYTNLLGILETNREVATALVFPTTDSYILMNSSVPIKTNINVTAFIGVGGLSSTGVLRVDFLDPISNDYIGESTVFGLSSGTNYRNVSFKNIGTYLVSVRNLNSDQVYASKTVSTYLGNITAPYNISTSSITLTRSPTNYTYNEVLTGQYQVDNTNYTAGVTYIDVFNVALNSPTSEFYGSADNHDDTSKQVGTVFIRIENFAATAGFPEVKFLPGENQLRLKLHNLTSGNEEVLAYVTFNLSTINNQGYSIQLTPKKIIVGSSVTIDIISPGRASFMRVDPAGKNTTYAINGSTSLKQVLTKVGNYNYQLFDQNNDIQMSDNVDVIAAPTTPSAGANIPTGTTAVTNMGNNMLYIISTVFFWGLMLLIAFAITVFSGKLPTKNAPLAVVAFAFIETLGGIFSPYTIPIFVVLVIIIALMFRKGQEVIGQE